MKQLIGLTLSAVLLAGGLNCKEREFPDIRNVITAQDVTPDLTKELAVGLHPDLAVRCDEGTSLPIQFLYRAGFFSAQFNPHFTLRVEKTVYLRFTKGKVFVSEDMIYWEKLSDLLDGAPNFNVGVSPDKTHISVEVEFIPSPEDMIDNN